MNKISGILIALVILLCLCACNKSTTPDNNSTTVSAKENPTLQPTTCDHEWPDSACTSPKNCTKCGAVKLGVDHTWKNATCTEPKICILCGESEGFTLDHDFGPYGSSPCKMCGYVPVKREDPISIRFHYYRPDGDYEGWNLWVWDNDAVPSTELDPPYEFEVVDGEAVCTIKVNADTQTIGYIVRYMDWVCKDIEEDQFIDISDIRYGTVDFYIRSGEEGGELVV